jgi:hypothetical protein
MLFYSLKPYISIYYHLLDMPLQILILVVHFKKCVAKSITNGSS